jgi:hypothetical protein
MKSVLILDKTFMVYSTAANANFTGAGTYEFTPERLTLRPEGGNSIIKYYKINKSRLTFGNDSLDAQYTRNPETGGGFNGEPGPAPLGGMWQNIADSTDCFAFNKDGEFFWNDIEKNNDGKFWWHVMGAYEYDSRGDDPDEFILNYYATPDGRKAESIPYTVKFTLNNSRIEFTESDGKVTTFDKKTNI